MCIKNIKNAFFQFIRNTSDLSPINSEGPLPGLPGVYSAVKVEETAGMLLLGGSAQLQ